MSFADAEKAIQDQFNTAWGATSQVAWENVNFTPDASSGAPWIEVLIEELSGSQVSLGPTAGRRFRTAGIVTVNVYVPVGDGKVEALALVDQASAFFRAAQITTPLGASVLFFAPFASHPGRSQKYSAWYATGMVIKFWFDEIA